MTTILVIGTIAVTSAGAGGRAETQNSVGYSDEARALATASRDVPPADRTPEVRYWHRWAGHWKRKALGWKRAYRRLEREHARVGASYRRRPTDTTSTRSIICSVFGAHCSEALRVAWCESRFNVYARNGQYLGLFQMGSFARARYGHSWTAYGQARAAYRYFLDAGWSPWACRP